MRLQLQLFGKQQSVSTFVGSAFFAAVGFLLMFSPGLFEARFDKVEKSFYVPRHSERVISWLELATPTFEQRWQLTLGPLAPVASESVVRAWLTIQDYAVLSPEIVQPTKPNTKKNARHKQVPIPRERPQSAPLRFAPSEIADTDTSITSPPYVVSVPPLTVSTVSEFNWPLIQWITTALAMLMSIAIGVFGRDVRRWIAARLARRAASSSSASPTEAVPLVSDNRP